MARRRELARTELMTVEHAAMRVLESIRSSTKQSSDGGEGWAAAGGLNVGVPASTMPV
jgi:hypothetical protein